MTTRNQYKEDSLLDDSTEPILRLLENVMQKLSARLVRQTP